MASSPATRRSRTAQAEAHAHGSARPKGSRDGRPLTTTPVANTPLFLISFPPPERPAPPAEAALKKAAGRSIFSFFSRFGSRFLRRALLILGPVHPFGVCAPRPAKLLPLLSSPRFRHGPAGRLFQRRG
ncbi:MAG: hypothetical protein MI923_16110 [Phycisphaerales bacterium]|nr:hypothetical protein [Phycisphaerales bacterium]